MMTMDDLLAALEKLDHQLVRLVADRRELVAQIPGGLTPEQELEIMSLWMDEAVERELDEASMEKIGKILAQMSRKRGE